MAVHFARQHLHFKNERGNFRTRSRKGQIGNGIAELFCLAVRSNHTLRDPDLFRFPMSNFYARKGSLLTAFPVTERSSALVLCYPAVGNH